MDIDKYLESYSKIEVHAQIKKLNDAQKDRVKRFIENLTQKSDINFEISKLNILSDRVEIAVEYELTMF